MSMEEADPIGSRGWKKLELDSDLMRMHLSGISQNRAKKGKSTELHLPLQRAQHDAHSFLQPSYLFFSALGGDTVTPMVEG